MNYQLVFRSRYGTFTTAVVFALSALFASMIWSSEGALNGLGAALIGAGLTYFSWFMWAWPAVLVSNRGISVRNQLRTFRVGWDAFKEAESSYGLYLLVESSPRSGTDADANVGAVADLDADAFSDARADAISEEFPLTGGMEKPPRRIYCAGVPARGGFTASRQKEAPLVPELYFDSGPRITLRVNPAVAVRMIDEEKILIDHEERRDPSHHASPIQVERWQNRSWLKQLLYGPTPDQSLSASPKRYKDVTIQINWPAVGGLGLLVVGALIYGFSL